MDICNKQCMFIFAISREAYETIDIEVCIFAIRLQKQVDDHHFKAPLFRVMDSNLPKKRDMNLANPVPTPTPS